MTRLELVIAVSDVLLGLYGTRNTRKKALNKKFGAENAVKIQKEVDKCLSDSAEAKYLAVACIADHYGKDPERSRKLGRWASKVQAKINAIYDMRGKSMDGVVKDVINNNYDKDDVRELLLKFCGYNPDAVQKAVNDKLTPKPTPAPTTGTKFTIHAIHFFKKNESLYGDCTAIYQYAADGSIAKCVLIDCASAGASSVVINELKKHGVKQIDAIVLSHAHGDHYGGLSNITKAFPVKWLYLPDCTQLDKYQKGYGNALRRQAKKIANHRYMKAGDHFVIGEIKCECLYIAPASKLKEHDSHHYVNNQSMALRFTMGGIRFHAAGDMQNAANSLMVSAVKDLRADILKIQWHGDGNATNDTLCKAIRPKYAFSNYHHKESKGGRQIARRRLEVVGCKVYRNWEDGDIFFNIQNGKITVKTSKG